MGQRTAFRAMLLEDLATDHYALRNRKALAPSPGQMGLFDDEPAGGGKWDEHAHPRAPKGAHEGHGGEFVKRGDSKAGKATPELFPTEGTRFQPALFGEDEPAEAKPEPKRPESIAPPNPGGQRPGEDNWEKGTLLKFKNPQSDWERAGQYAVVEMRGPRVMVMDTRFADKHIPPLDVFDTSEMEPHGGDSKPKGFQPKMIEPEAKPSGLKDHPKHESDRDQLIADLENAEGMGGWDHARKIRAELDAKHPGWDDENMGYDEPEPKLAEPHPSVSNALAFAKHVQNGSQANQHGQNHYFNDSAARKAFKDHKEFGNAVQAEFEKQAGASKGHGKTYDVNGQGFDSFKEATAHAKSIGADVNETATGQRRWTPAAAVDPKKQRQYNERKAAYDAQTKLNEQQAAERKARDVEAMAKPRPITTDELKAMNDKLSPAEKTNILDRASQKPSGIQPVTRSNDEAKAGDQLGLFGEAARPKREAPPMLAPGGESKGKAQALFDTHGNADQMDLFGDGIMPEELVAKESRANTATVNAAISQHAMTPEERDHVLAGRWDKLDYSLLDRLQGEAEMRRQFDKAASMLNEIRKRDGFVSPFDQKIKAKAEAKGFQPMLLDDGAQKKTEQPDKLEPIPFRDRRSFADKMAADGRSHSDIVEAMQARGVAASDARRHAANALGDKAQGEGSFAKPADTAAVTLTDEERDNLPEHLKGVIPAFPSEAAKLRDIAAKNNPAKKLKPTTRESAIRKAIEANGGHGKNSVDDVDKIRDSLYYNDDARADGAPPKHADIRAVMEQMKNEAGQKFEKSAAGKRAADPRYSDPMSITPERSSGASLTDHDSALVDLQDAHERLERAKKDKADDHTLKLESPGSDRHARASAAHDKVIADAEKTKARAFAKFVPHAERIAERNKGFQPKLLEGSATQAEEPAAKPAEPSMDELAKSAVEAGGSIWKHAKEKIGRGLVEMTPEERKAYAEAAQKHSEAKREAEKPPVSAGRAAAQQKFLEMRDREAAEEKAAAEQPAAEPRSLGELKNDAKAFSAAVDSVPADDPMKPALEGHAAEHSKLQGMIDRLKARKKLTPVPVKPPRDEEAEQPAEQPTRDPSKPAPNYGDLVKDRDGLVGTMRGSGGMGSGRVGVIDQHGQKHWRNAADLAHAEDSDIPEGHTRESMPKNEDVNGELKKPKPAPKPAGPEPVYKVRDDLPMKQRLEAFHAGTLKPGDEIDVGGNSPAVISRVNAKSVTTVGGASWKHHEYKPVGKYKDAADLRSQLEEFERAGGIEGVKARASRNKNVKAAVLRLSDNPLEKVLAPEGLKQILEAKSDHIGHIAEQLAGSMPGMDRAAVRQAILDHRKANGVNEEESKGGPLKIAAKSATPTLDELEHALQHVEQHGSGWRLVDPETGSHVAYSTYDNKNQAVNAFINKIRHRATRTSQHDSEYQNSGYTKVRGNYKSWLKSHGANEHSILGLDPKHIKAQKEAAVANAQMSLADLKAHLNKLDAGEVSPEEHRAAFDKFMASRDGIKAELSKLKKDEIAGWHHQDGIRVLSHRDETKDKALNSTLSRMMHDFNKTESANRWSYGEDRDETLRKAIEGTTADHLKAHAESHANEVKARQERQKANQDKFDNPQTAEDWRFKRNHVGGYHKLTPEQQAAHDEAYASYRREKQPFKPVKQTTVEGFKGGSEKTGNVGIVEGFHQKHQKPTFTVTVEEHLGDSWKDVLSKAKALGGNYVNAFTAKRYGATAGFQFMDQEKAKQFHAVLGGQSADISDKVDDREAERRANQVDTLAERAAAIKERAEASLGRQRKDNTARRARMAASSEADARKDMATAKTLESLANHIDGGKAVHLQHVRNRAQVDELDSQLRRAKWNHISAVQKTPEGKNMGYNDREAMHNAEPSQESIAHAEYPYPYLHANEMEKMAGKLSGVPGLKMFGAKLRKMAAEMKAQSTEQNGNEYGQITNWSDLEKLKEAIPKMRRHGSPEIRSMASRFAEKFESMKRLEGMDITNTAELRAALREFHNLKVKPEGPDPIKEAERKLKRMKIEGFFPTPKTLVERMLDHADIEDGHEVLEPSAGIGHIMDAIKERHPEAKLHGIEKDYEISELLGLKGHTYDRGDFLEHSKQYDRIVMNPPFEHRQDEKHVKHAYSLLKPGGKLVAITGSGAHSNERSAGFRDWLSEVGAKTYENPAGSFDTDEAFKKTGVNTHMVIISKPTGEPEKYSMEFEPVFIDHYAGKDQMAFSFGEEHEPNNPSFSFKRPKSQSSMQDLADSGGLRVVGVSRDVHTCDRCGRSDLDRTIIVATPNGDEHYYGSDCVSKILNRSSSAIENEALLADQRNKVRKSLPSKYASRFSPVFLRSEQYV